MPKWIPCGEKFVIGNVVRWKEAVWVEKGKRKKKLIKVGERRVTAEVLTTDAKAFVCLSVCKCEILANLAARVLEPFKKGGSIRRAKWRRARMERRRRAGARNKQVPGLMKAVSAGLHPERITPVRRAFSSTTKSLDVYGITVHTGSMEGTTCNLSAFATKG
jgi:hypothetical protein